MGYKRAKTTKVALYFRGDLKKQIFLNRGHVLPGFIDFGVCKSLMATYICRWEPEAKELHSCLSASVRRAGQYFFQIPSRGHVRATRLLVLFTNVFLVHPREMDFEASSRMVYLLEQETEIPMTMKHYLSGHIQQDPRRSNVGEA